MTKFSALLQLVKTHKSLTVITTINIIMFAGSVAAVTFTLSQNNNTQSVKEIIVEVPVSVPVSVPIIAEATPMPTPTSTPTPSPTATPSTLVPKIFSIYHVDGYRLGQFEAAFKVMVETSATITTPDRQNAIIKDTNYELHFQILTDEEAASIVDLVEHPINSTLIGNQEATTYPNYFSDISRVKGSDSTYYYIRPTAKSCTPIVTGYSCTGIVAATDRTIYRITCTISNSKGLVECDKVIRTFYTKFY